MISIIKNYINVLIDCYHKIDNIPVDPTDIEAFKIRFINPLTEALIYKIADAVEIPYNTNKFETLWDMVDENASADEILVFVLNKED